MKTKKKLLPKKVLATDYMKQYSKMENDVKKELLSQLKRVGRDFGQGENDDETEVDNELESFFNTRNIDEASITGITSDGKIIFSNQEDSTVLEQMSEGVITLLDAISLLEDLREMPTAPKKKTAKV